MKVNADIQNVEKVCKKCGTPLTSKSKYKCCDNCRRERAKTRKEIAGTVSALCIAALTIVPGVKHFVNKK
ncbi:MAG: hypothetical protein RR313_09445 [Anaerovoracaceae bacterium]